MTQSITPYAEPETRARTTDDVDLAQVFAVLRRYWLPLLLVPALLAALTYLMFQRVPPTFEATTSLMATQPDSSNQVLSGASVKAAQLPQGAVDEVVHSKKTVQRIQADITASALPETVKANIAQSLTDELADRKYRRIVVKARVDQLQRGVYDLKASAESPEAARLLADAAAQALLAWDVQRSREGVTRARQNIQEQLQNLTARLSGLPEGSLERQSLVAARGQLVLDLSQATVFEQGAMGNLTLLADANAPRKPVAPKPMRNAALVGLLSLFVGVGLALLFDSLRRKVRSTADVVALNVPSLGELPRLSHAARGQVTSHARTGEFYEPSGFLRVNLMSLVPGKPAIIGVTSARPGEGKSTVIATTATSLAMSGKKVLILDLDLHRPTQHEYWQVVGRPLIELPGATETAQTTIVQAIQEPYYASAVEVSENIHFVPAGEAGRRAAAILSSPAFSERLKQWAQAYDVVLLDTPPVLSMADAFVVGKHADGLVVVVESGETSVPELQRVLRTFQTTSTRLLGVVVNKVRRGQQGYYYAYQYSTPAKR